MSQCLKKSDLIIFKSKILLFRIKFYFIDFRNRWFKIIFWSMSNSIFRYFSNIVFSVFSSFDWYTSLCFYYRFNRVIGSRHRFNCFAGYFHRSGQPRSIGLTHAKSGTQSSWVWTSERANERVSGRERGKETRVVIVSRICGGSRAPNRKRHRLRGFRVRSH